MSSWGASFGQSWGDSWGAVIASAVIASQVHPGLPIKVRSRRRHTKPNTFRTELERLIYGEKAVEAAQEAIVAKEVAALIERFNLLNTMDSQAIQAQMLAMSQDIANANALLTQINMAKQIEAQNEEVILMLVAGEL